MMRERSATYEGRGNTTTAGGDEWEGHHHNDLLPLAALLAVRWQVFLFYSIIK